MKKPSLPSGMDAYELNNWPSKRSTVLLFPKYGGKVDLATLTPEKADRLIQRKFPYLQKKKETASKAIDKRSEK